MVFSRASNYKDNKIFDAKTVLLILFNFLAFFEINNEI